MTAEDAEGSGTSGFLAEGRDKHGCGSEKKNREVTMMRFSRSVLGGAVAAAIVLGLLAAAPLRAEPADGLVTITGPVRIAQFGARGETVRVYVDAAEEPVLVSRRDRGKELLTLVGATVRATGYVRKIRSDEGFNRTIDVTEYVVEAPAVAKPRGTADHELSDD